MEELNNKYYILLMQLLSDSSIKLNNRKTKLRIIAESLSRTNFDIDAKNMKLWESVFEKIKDYYHQYNLKQDENQRRLLIDSIDTLYQLYLSGNSNTISYDYITDDYYKLLSKLIEKFGLNS